MRCAGLIAALTLAILMTTVPAAADTRTLSAHIEVGAGATVVTSLPKPSGRGAMISGGLSRHLSGMWRLALELAVSAGANRSLSGALLGAEVDTAGPGARPFVFAGVGYGLEALGPTKDVLPVPPPGGRGLAWGAALGYRYRPVDRPIGLQVAMRTHGVVHSGETAAAYVVSIGLVY